MTTQNMERTATTATSPRLIEAGLQAVERVMLDVVNSDVDVLRDASRHILQAGGKRIRPRLLMLAYIATGGTDVDHAAPPAAAVELMHTASVVHDDINDHGVIRRGRKSVNAIWGRTFALLTGDFLFTSVYKLMAGYGDLNISLAKAASALVEGETLQAAAVKNNEFTRENYARIIGLKTAALFQSAAEMGAMLSNSDDEVVEALATYGYNIGLAFQIVDDILDIVGDEEKLGKTAGIDIEQGRGFASVQNGNGSNGHNGNGSNGSHSNSAEDIMNKVKSKLMKGDRLQEARRQARDLVDIAIEELDILPPSDAKRELITLAHLVIERDH